MKSSTASTSPYLGPQTTTAHTHTCAFQSATALYQGHLSMLMGSLQVPPGVLQALMWRSRCALRGSAVGGTARLSATCTELCFLPGPTHFAASNMLSISGTFAAGGRTAPAAAAAAAAGAVPGGGTCTCTSPRRSPIFARTCHHAHQGGSRDSTLTHTRGVDPRVSGCCTQSAACLRPLRLGVLRSGQYRSLQMCKQTYLGVVHVLHQSAHATCLNFCKHLLELRVIAQLLHVTGRAWAGSHALQQ
jgi:hypothetical protein